MPSTTFLLDNKRLHGDLFGVLITLPSNAGHEGHGSLSSPLDVGRDQTLAKVGQAQAAVNQDRELASA